MEMFNRQGGKSSTDRSIHRGGRCCAFVPVLVAKKEKQNRRMYIVARMPVTMDNVHVG